MKWFVNQFKGVLKTVGALAVLVALESGAQKPPLAPHRIEGFRLPEYDENGRLKSQVLGEVAEMRADGRIDITDLRIEIFRSGQKEGTIRADRCVFDPDKRSAQSDTAVSIETERLLITGMGLQWEAEGQILRILNQARVELKQGRVWPRKE